MVLRVVNNLKRKLINLENVKEYIVEKEFHKEKNMIISPNVNDYLKVNGIKIVNAGENKMGDIKIRIENILKNEFNITDDSTLKKAIKKVEEVIKNGY